MKSLIAFVKKEFTEQIRSGKLIFLGMLFLLIGVMNPAVAKLTPFFIEMFADSLSGSGIIITEIEVTAMDSWVQFFKNVPIALIAYVLVESGIFTKEYQSGTLVLSLTKGLMRFKVVVAKTFTLFSIWTVGYWLIYVITYGYNSYFWDNSIAENLVLSAVCWWIFGLWVLAILILFSVICTSNSIVLLGTSGVVFASYILGLIPKIEKLFPTKLMDGATLIYAKESVGDYVISLIIALTMVIFCIAVSVYEFNKKQL